MIYSLLLLASVSWGQEASTSSISIPVDTQIEISNLGKAVLELQSGRPTITGLPTYQKGIKFSNTSGSALTFKDGTAQNTAAVTTTIGTSTSTINNIESVATSATTMGPCFAKSTLTWTNNGLNPVMIGAIVTASNSSGGGQSCMIQVVVDGAFLYGGSPSIGQTDMSAPGVGFEFPLNIGPIVTQPLAAGSHTVCLSGKASSGTCTFKSAQNQWLLFAWEIK